MGGPGCSVTCLVKDSFVLPVSLSFPFGFGLSVFGLEIVLPFNLVHRGTS